MIRFIGGILFFISVSTVSGQVYSLVKLSSDSIEIGEKISLYIEIENNSDASIVAVDYSAFNNIEKLLETQASNDSINRNADIEWTGKYAKLHEKNYQLSGQVIANQTNKYFFRDTVDLVFWESGVFSIPSAAVSLDDSIPVYASENQILKVGFPQDLINPDTSSVILPIQDIMLENKTWQDYIWIAWILLSLLLVYFIYRLVNRPKEEIIPPEPEEIKLPAHIIAYRKLDHIESNNLHLSTDFKQYHTQLTFCLREYLENRFGIPALESTTSDIQNALSKLGLPADIISQFLEILQIADLVKFAKAEATSEINTNFLHKTRKLIESTRIVLSEQAEMEVLKKHEEYLEELKKYKSFKHDG